MPAPVAIPPWSSAAPEEGDAVGVRLGEGLGAVWGKIEVACMPAFEPDVEAMAGAVPSSRSATNTPNAAFTSASVEPPGRVGVMLRLDHVVYAVGDLDDAAVRFREAFGLDSVAGGRHERWGTANRIVPLGEQYLELVAAVDREAAAAGGFGRAVMDRADTGGGWITLAVATDDLDGVADRLGLEIGSGSRTRPDGQVVRWRMVGLDDTRRQPWMPFFLAWDVPGQLHPGRARAGHGVRADRIAWVEVAGDPDRLHAWLGAEELRIRMTDGEPGIRRVAVATTEAELIIE